jgi:methylase of polypeptide subunit release factors
MQRNLELSEEDARNELRWIRQAVRDRETRAATAVLSVKGRGESVAELVERRVKGEPLQYILGKWLPTVSASRSK